MIHPIDLLSICRSVTCIYGPGILLHVLKTIYSSKVVHVLGMIDQCHSETDLINYMSVSDLYFMVH